MLAFYSCDACSCYCKDSEVSLGQCEVFCIVITCPWWGEETNNNKWYVYSASFVVWQALLHNLWVTTDPPAQPARSACSEQSRATASSASETRFRTLGYPVIEGPRSQCHPWIPSELGVVVFFLYEPSWCLDIFGHPSWNYFNHCDS